MARLIAEFTQFLDGKGNPLPGAKLFFFANKTANLKDTWSDADLTNLNSNPVIADGSGYAPPIFGQEAYTVTLKTKDGVFVSSFDDVTPEGDDVGAAFAAWSPTVIYTPPAYVTASDGCIYKATDSSTDVDPTTDATGASWEKIEFVQYWISAKTYSLGEQVKVADNSIHISLKNSNINKNPVGDGGVNWQAEGDDIKAWVTGRTYAIGDVVYGTDGRLHKAVSSQSGNNPVGASSTNWLPNDGVTSKPVNTTPADTATGVSRMPTLIGSAYNVNGSTAAHEWSRFRTYADNGRVTTLSDSGISTDLTTHTVSTQLPASTQIFWDVEYKGIRTDISELSTLTSFTTTLNLSESFDNLIFTGSGSTQSVIAVPDLVANSGSVWLVNTGTTDSMRVMDTDRGVGVAYLVPSIIETAEATGLTTFNINGYDVGAAAAYNGSGNTIWSMVIRKLAKFFDMVAVSGTGINRTVAHALAQEVGFMVGFQETGADPGGAGNFCWFRGMNGSQHFRFGTDSAITTDSSAWSSTAPTTSVFSLGTSQKTNGTSRTYTYYLAAHNPDAGSFCDTFSTSGTPTNKVTTGMPGGTAFLKNHLTDEWILIDRKLGAGSQIDLDNQGQLVSGTNISSFDSDGITFSNLASGTWSVWIISDPDF